MERRKPLDADGIARQVSDAIGDGCVVRLVDAARTRLRAVAVDRREGARSAALGSLARADWSALRGWGGHVLQSGRPVRLAGSGWRHLTMRGPGGASRALERGVAAMLIAPLRVADEVCGVVVAMREHGGVPYSLHEQALLERVVGRATADRTVPRTARAALRAEELSGQLLLRGDGAVWATDADGLTLALTPAMAEMLALPLGEAIGLPISDFVDPPPVSAVVSAEPERSDRRLMRASGGSLWVATTSTPLIDAHGRRRGLLTTVTDVTERKQLEIALRIRLDAAVGVARVMAGVLRGDDPGELLECAVDAVADVLGVRRAGVFELRGDGSLLLRAGRGWGPGMIGSHRIAMLGSPAALALTGAEPVAVRDTARLQRGAVATDVRSGCWVGIGGGVLAALHDEPRDFDGDERAFLSSLAGVLVNRVGMAAPATPSASSAVTGLASMAGEALSY